MIGRTLAHYRITAAIGAGGMTSHSVEETDGVHFFTMELVEGQPPRPQARERGGDE